MSGINAATLRQNQAAEPGASTWLSANAGSGKTRVLTDRVARLLLDGVEPQNILCLTYTKAAASEMQNRLFERLGKWSMMPDESLALALADMCVLLPMDQLVRARRLFAAAIETPGGLRIQTIHSFCASLLRRFPLEAGLSPRFAEMDDRAAALLRDEIVEEMAAGAGRAAIDGIAAYLTDIDLSALTASVANNRLRLAVSKPEDIWSWLGLRPGYSETELAAETFGVGDTDLLTALRQVLQSSDSSNDQKAADKLASLDFNSLGASLIEPLAGLFLFGSSAANPYGAKVGKFPTKASRAALGFHEAALDDLMQRIETAREPSNRLYSAEKTLALYQFADVFLTSYSRQKQARGWLDFDDLIQKASALLSNDLVATWVLYRLDGGLDHILVDEAQDTSPAQWQVIERLAQEFTAGVGARDETPRSIFVVGDKKQSIYSFQGADPSEFDRMQEHFREKLGAIGIPLRPMELEYSFRSSEAVLRVVSEVLTKTDAPHLTPDTKHLAFYPDLPGRVDIWGVVPVSDKPDKQNWFDPVDIVGENHHDVVLARKIAAQIKELIGIETIPCKNGRRLIAAGDFLILVRRRSRLFEEIIRACKALKLPVAGADRLKLGGELAVKDLSALLAFIATPEDDLSLAATLRSPLFGWTEAELFDLAAGRSEPFLWTTLRNRAERHPDTFERLQDLRDRSDYLRPYDLIERILTRHDGRRRLLARLGPEAEDGIDALLNQALAFERMEVPSLTGFLVWMETDDVEVKRQMDSAGDLIRVMTVHGAKGLESPIVILPDTNKRNLPLRDQIVPLESGGLVWKPNADRQPEAVKAALSRLKVKQEEEALRLLYVAMTRAETWLIVAAAGDVGDAGESWYQIIAQAAKNMGSVPYASPTGPGQRYSHADWHGGVVETAPAASVASVELPGWATARAMAPDRAEAPLSPSDLGGAKALIGEGDRIDTESVLRRGRLMHRLLEHLAGTDANGWEDMVPGLLAFGEDVAPPDEALAMLEEVRPVLASSELRYLFSSDALAEVGISAELQELGGSRISGTIDRLVITPDRVLAIDFKTNALVAERAQDVPEGLLRQMGAYRAALQQVYPGRTVETAILWTRTAALMVLPDDIVMQALLRTATS